MGLLLLTWPNQEICLNEIWEKVGLGIDFIQSAMSQKRFSFLLRSLHFDNIMDTQGRSVADNLGRLIYV
jgi:hypothetical protein